MLTNRKGFTLIELVAVIAILGIILAITLPSISGVIKSSKEKACVLDASMMERAAKNYATLEGLYIAEGDMVTLPLESLQSKNYVSPIYSPEDRITECDGYVNISNENGTYKYNSFIKCGLVCKTAGYDDTSDGPILSDNPDLQDKNGALYYVGDDPDNWVIFGRLDQTDNYGLLWRILKVDDAGIKLIYEGRENGGTKPAENGRAVINGTTGVAWDSAGSNKWEDPVSLKTDLNNWLSNVYVPNMNDFAVSTNWRIGGVPYTNPTMVNTFIEYEKIDSTNTGGNFKGLTSLKSIIGLETATDFISASSNAACNSSYLEAGSGNECALSEDETQNNWLYKNKYHWWTMNARSDTDYKAWVINNAGQVATALTNSSIVSVRPVINISKDAIYYTGTGTVEDPYIIEDYMVGLSDKPAITLNGTTPYVVKEGNVYIEEGATAVDEQDGDISSSISITSNVNIDIPGTYKVTYDVTDIDGNKALTITREVIVVEKDRPVLNLNGSNPMYVTLNHQYIEPGATAIDLNDGDISSNIVITGSVDATTLGTYIIKYNVTNSENKPAIEVTRKIIVEVPRPVITLNGDANTLVGIGSTYTEQGAIATDEVDGNITDKISTSIYINGQKVSIVNGATRGSYTIKYQVTNSLGGSATMYRYVNVVSVSGPTITFNPSSDYYPKKQNETTVTVAAATHPVVLDSVKYLWIKSGKYVSNLENAINTPFKSGDTLKVPTGTNYYSLYAIAKDEYDDVSIRQSGSFVIDNYYPTIDLYGSSVVDVLINGSYSERGARADDHKYDGDVTNKIVTTSTVNTSVAGTYFVTYTVSDRAGNTTIAKRRVNVNNPVPTIKLNGSSNINILINTPYTDAGATASDALDGNISGSLISSGIVDSSKAGTYYITYSVTNSYGVTTTSTRTVRVYLPTSVITITGDNPFNLRILNPYADQGATATDAIDGDITSSIITTNTVNPNVGGVYNVTYRVTNSYGVVTTKVRTVNVNVPIPTITLNGASYQEIFLKGTYSDLGATATDEIDGNVTNKIIASGTVNPNVAGTYKITYSATNSVGGTGTSIRTVKVRTPKTTIALNGTNPYVMDVGDSYTELGFKATDEKDGDITTNVSTTTNLNPNVVGRYSVTYTITNSSGIYTKETRTIDVIALQGPTFELVVNGSATYNKNYNVMVNATQNKKEVDETSLKYIWSTSSTKPKADAFTTSFINHTAISGPSGVTGKYYLYVLGKDILGFTSILKSNAYYFDSTSPVITLTGLKVYQVPIDGVYTEPGATVVEAESGINSDGIAVTSNIIPSVLGKYTVTYTATDRAGNIGTETRTVSVVQVSLGGTDGFTPKYYADYFVGTNPSNWLEFGQVSRFDDRPLLWRIVRSDTEGIKIIYEGIKKTDNTVPSENGRVTIAGTQTHPYDTSNSNLWNKPVSIVSLLQTWYDDLYEPDKGTLTKPINWCVGAINSPYGLDDFKNTECTTQVASGQTFDGKSSNSTSVGFINSSDYMLTSPGTCSSYNSTSCGTNNFLAKNYNYLTLNADGATTTNIFTVMSAGGLGSRSANTLSYVRPVINLRGDVLVLGGDGTIEEPYKLNTRIPIIDTVPPVITFDPNGGFTNKTDYTVEIVATDTISGIQGGTLKYEWTTSTTKPAESAITNTFVNGDKISLPSTTSGTYYLWAMARDNKNTLTIQGSAAFKLDTAAPVITVKGTNPSGVETGSSYTDAGATALDDLDGNVTVIVTSDVNPNVTGVYSVTYTATDSTGNKATAIRIVNVQDPITGESIIAAVKTINRPDGNYRMIANGASYNIELINVSGDTTYSSANGNTVSLGNATADERMLVVKYNGNLTIESGVTVTASVRKKGMFIYTAGTLVNNGTITMTARGATAEGQDVYLWKNADGTYEYVSAGGATGAAGFTYTAADGGKAGTKGYSGQNRQTGGGGSGGVFHWIDASGKSGNGSAGTSYSGGSGGGGSDLRGASTVSPSGAVNGGAGGRGLSNYSTGHYAGGGAGNPGGTGNYNGSIYPEYNGSTGTGGLLIIYASSIDNRGVISSDGSAGGASTHAGGGSSGGGSINIFGINTYQSSGTVSAGSPIGGSGGAGGNGTATAGLIYQGSFIQANPKVTFSLDSGVQYKTSYGLTVTATSPKIGIKAGSTKYVWTTSATAPAESAFVNDFVSGSSITTPSNVSGVYYIWVIAKDNTNNSTIQSAGPFNIDSIPPTITMAGTNPSTLYTGEIYSDAGATATDNRDGNIAVSTTSDVNPSVGGTYSVTYTATDSVGNTATATRIVKVYGSITADSILAAVKDNEWPEGNQKVVANGVLYDVESINIDGNTTYSSNTLLGNSTADERMLIVKYNGDLTIDSGVTVAATTRKKGMIIYVTGTLTNNGTISMTGRGAIGTGQNVYLWKNTDGSYEYIPATGATGGATVSLSNAGSINITGLSGNTGIDRRTGGGGSGGVFNNVSGTAISGKGGTGTSYSGGSGGGATTSRGGTYTGNAGSSAGGAGGAAVSSQYSNSGGYSAGGGAGNPGGAPNYPSCCVAYAGSAGTGGLLVVYATSIYNNGSIVSNGVQGGYGSGASGGSSGGGSINLFVANNYKNVGTIGAFGGVKQATGGAGGIGSVTAGYISNNNFNKLMDIGFDYTGDYQTFTTTKAGVYQIELWGAQGGATLYNNNNTGASVAGGLGGYTMGQMTLAANETFYIYVGGKGQNGAPNLTSAGGYNGGGTGGLSYQGGAGGGGATDIRLVSGTWNDTDSLRSRIMVSGGGGGTSNWTNATTGGYGGGLTGRGGILNPGSVAHTLAVGGSQTAAGTGASNGFAGSYNIGGNAQSGHGGGGGAGYYGGGGGGLVGGGVSSGAGGSSFISGYTGCNAINSSGTHTGQPNHYSGEVFTNTLMIAGSTSMPGPTGALETGHAGNGYARITYISE